MKRKTGFFILSAVLLSLMTACSSKPVYSEEEKSPSKDEAPAYVTPTPTGDMEADVVTYVNGALEIFEGVNSRQDIKQAKTRLNELSKFIDFYKKDGRDQEFIRRYNVYLSADPALKQSYETAYKNYEDLRKGRKDAEGNKQ